MVYEEIMSNICPSPTLSHIFLSKLSCLNGYASVEANLHFLTGKRKTTTQSWLVQLRLFSEGTSLNLRDP